jgi:murein DD-endopeptidase MepM/ murein hydrolase activator NlpD
MLRLPRSRALCSVFASLLVCLPLTAYAVPMTDGFDYPVGKPNAAGYYDAQGFGQNGHLGEDWNGNGGGNSDYGDPVYAVSNGYVAVSQDFGGGWGQVVMIQHDTPDGIRTTMYAHLSEIGVSKGWDVARGQQIGKIGDCNGRYYAHLHFELRLSDNTANGNGYGSANQGQTDPSNFIDGHRPPWGTGDACFKAWPGRADSPDLRNDTIHMDPGEHRNYTFFCFNRGTSVWPASGDYYMHHNGREQGLGPALDNERVDWETRPGNAWTKPLGLIAPSTPGTYRLTARMAHREGDYYREFGEYIDVDIVVGSIMDMVGRRSTNPQLFRDEYVRHGGEANFGRPRGDVGPWGPNVPEGQDFEKGGPRGSTIQWNRTTGEAHIVYGAIYERYVGVGGAPDVIGCAITDEIPIGPSASGTTGVFQEFLKLDGRGGAVFSNALETLWLNARHWVSYRNFGGPYSYLGWLKSSPYANGADEWVAYEKGWTTRDSEPVLFPSFPTPVTTARIVGGTLGANGWYTTPVTIQLEPNMPSVDRWWVIWGEDWQYNPPARRKTDWNPADTRWVDHLGEPLVIDRKDVKTFSWYSRMTEGAQIASGGAPHYPELPQTMELKIDPDPPGDSTIVFSPAGSAPVGTSVRLQVACTDAISGMERGVVWVRRENPGLDPGVDPEWPGDWWTKLYEFSGDTADFPWTTTGLAPGLYHFHVDTYDKAGNHGWWPCFTYRLVGVRRQPDLLAGKTDTGPFVGGNVYEATPVTQVVALNRQVNKAAKYYLRLQNDGNVADRLVLTGPGGGSAWTVKYLQGWENPKDITSSVLAGGWRTWNLAPGETAKVIVIVTPRSAAAVGARKNVTVTLTSAASASRKDAVKLLTKRVEGTADAPAAAAAMVTGLGAVPTRAGVQVTFGLSSAAEVGARVLNLSGRPVRALCQGRACAAGSNTLLWNALSDSGLPVPNGTYLVEVTARGADGAQSRAVAMVRVNR